MASIPAIFFGEQHPDGFCVLFQISKLGTRYRENMIALCNDPGQRKLWRVHPFSWRGLLLPEPTSGFCKIFHPETAGNTMVIGLIQVFKFLDLTGKKSTI